MPRYTLALFGLEISFKTDAEAKRIEAAQALLEERYADLRKNAGDISKEKLLAFLALSLADDVIGGREEREAIEEKIGELLGKTP